VFLCLHEQVNMRNRAEVPTEVFRKLPAEKRERIISTAVEEFAEHGFHQASINRLVKRLGIAKGSIFQYFTSKEGLFQAVFDHCVDQARKPLREIKHHPEGMGFFDKIRATLEAGIRFVRAHPQAYKLYLKMIFQENFPYREKLLSRLHLFSADYLEDLIRQGIEKGEIRKDINVPTAVFFLDALLDRFIQAYVVAFWDASSVIHQAKDEDLKKHIEEFVKLIRSGLEAKTNEHTC